MICMKTRFLDKLHLSPKNKDKLGLINRIIEEYRRQGYRLTLRQLYYQLVSRDVIPNNVKEYAKLSGLLVQGRMAGVVDWEAIEDRIRVPYLPYWVSGITSAINDTVDQYRLNRMRNQDVYIEVWVEKDALSGVLKRITSHYHVNLMVNRGYSSCTAMHDAYLRIQRQESHDKECYILYLGDHDPSGVDMVRDIRERLEQFGVWPEVKRIALTKEQIDEYNPPPNPAKITDPRAKAYIAEFGRVSWEVDALKPQVLHQIIKDEIESLIDMEKFNEMLSQEENDISKLEEFRDKFEEESDDNDSEESEDDDDGEEGEEGEEGGDESVEG